MLLKDCASLVRVVLKQGSLAPGGLNFDAKVRRESRLRPAADSSEREGQRGRRRVTPKTPRNRLSEGSDSMEEDTLISWLCVPSSGKLNQLHACC